MGKDFKREYPARANAALAEIYDIAAIGRGVIVNSVAVAGGRLALDPERETHAWVGDAEYVTSIYADEQGAVMVQAKDGNDGHETLYPLDGMYEMDIIAIAVHLVVAGYDIGGEPEEAGE